MYFSKKTRIYLNEIGLSTFKISHEVFREEYMDF